MNATNPETRERIIASGELCRQIEELEKDLKNEREILAKARAKHDDTTKTEEFRETVDHIKFEELFEEKIAKIEERLKKLYEEKRQIEISIFQNGKKI